MQIVKVPVERVKFLRQRAEDIEREGNVGLGISPEGEVSIKGEGAVSEWKAIDVVKAVGRGFSVDAAIKLFSDDYALKVVNLKEMFDKQKQRERYKARIIGTKGKAKRIIENTSGAALSIYGNTISIIGKVEEAVLAEKAVLMLLKGASHGTTYYVLQKERQKMME
jgi:ribosomal RNA assembly protein